MKTFGWQFFRWSDELYTHSFSSQQPLLFTSSRELHFPIYQLDAGSFNKQKIRYQIAIDTFIFKHATTS